MGNLTKHDLQYLIEICREKQGIKRHDIVSGNVFSKQDVYHLENKLTNMLIEIGELC